MEEKIIFSKNLNNPSRYMDNKQDIISKAKVYIQAAEKQLGIGMKELTKEAEDFLLSHNWSDGEKELELAVKRACIMSESPMLRADDFDLKQKQMKSIGQFVESRLQGFMKNIKRFEKFDLYNMVIPEVEKALIIMVMTETKGNQIKAARLLGINRNTLRSKIKKLGIKVRR